MDARAEFVRKAPFPAAACNPCSSPKSEHQWMNECLQASCGAPGSPVSQPRSLDTLAWSAWIPCPSLPAPGPPDTPMSCPLPLLFSLWCFLLTSTFLHCLLSWPSTPLSPRKPKMPFEKDEDNLILSKTAYCKRKKGRREVGRLILRKNSPKCHNSSFTNSCHEYILFFSTWETAYLH